MSGPTNTSSKEEKILKRIQNMKENSGMFFLDDRGDRGERRMHCIFHLQFESVRLATFYFFRYKNTVDIRELAKKGFVYERSRDIVLCSFCSVELRSNNNFQVPLGHAGENDYKCILADFPLNGNISLDDPLPNCPVNRANILLEEFRTKRITDSVSYKNHRIDFYKAHFDDDIHDSNFSSYESRLSTFRCWFVYLSEHERPEKERFAEAGFVYTGYMDFITCFKCKGGLFNIRKDDDPFQDHAKFYGHCPFIREYCSANKIEMEFEHEEFNLLMPHEIEILLDHPMMKHLHKNYKFELDDIRRWMEVYVNYYCSLPLNIAVCQKGLNKEIQWEEERMMRCSSELVTYLAQGIP